MHRNTAVVGRLNGILDIVEILHRERDSWSELQQLEEVSSDSFAVEKSKKASLKHRIRAHRGAIKKIEIVTGYALTSSSDGILKVFISLPIS